MDGGVDAELQEHLDHCAHCTDAIADSRLAGNLMRQVMQPANNARPEFFLGVMARIQDEKARAESPAAFWRPLEFLASRVSLTAAIILLALSAYVVGFAPHRNMAPQATATELSASDFPQPPLDPVSNEEVLQSLTESYYGH
jgi:hypothetical protein